MRKFLLVVVAALTGFVSQAQEQKDGAKIKFVTQEIDYGTIKQNADGLRVFEFMNTGNAPLVLTGASSTCGCTVPSFSREPIAPGAKGKVEVRYATNRLGSIRKTITVTSNAVDTPTVYLTIKGEVLAAEAAPAEQVKQATPAMPAKQEAAKPAKKAKKQKQTK